MVESNARITRSPLRAILRRLGTLERHGASPTSIAILVVTATIGYLQALPGIVTVFVVTSVVFSEFVRRLDQGVPLMHITAIVSVLQWLVGPALAFYADAWYGRYFMYVPVDTYFEFAVPGTALYCVGLLCLGASPRQKLLALAMRRHDFVAVGVLLYIIAVGSDVVSVFVTGELRFLFLLCSQFRYVAAAYFLLSTHRWKYLFAGAACMHLVAASTATGLFHDLILWMTLLSCYWFAQRKRPFAHKVAFVLIGCSCVWTIQIAKQGYRLKIADNHRTSVLSELSDIVLEPQRLVSQEALIAANSRLNQGWIISAIMKNVPQEEPLAEGETVTTALLSSIVPRVLWPDKKRAGGQENFRRFTGLPIQRETSMGISPLGEAYANYGVDRGIVFMLAYGILFSSLYYFILRYVARYPELLLWIPLIFYQGIKAETELVVVLNQVIKGSVVAFAGYYALNQILQRDPLRRRLRRPVL